MCKVYAEITAHNHESLIQLGSGVRYEGKRVSGGAGEII